MTTKLVKKYRRGLFYARNLVQHVLVPKAIFRRTLDAKLRRIDDYDPTKIRRRVDYCNKLTTPFEPGDDFATLKELRLGTKNTYIFDAAKILRHFDPTLRFGYIFGDTRIVPEIPKIVKSRPIGSDNENSVILRLNQIRHFHFVEDSLPFERKKAAAVWRGKRSKKPARVELLTRFAHHPRFDIGDSDPRRRDDPWYKGFLTIPQQLNYKFILSVEGNDVASNLKWILASNSLCLMPRPRFETWLMEGTLIPDYHYVLLKDDFSDLEEKVDHYSRHTEEALAIVRNANRYIAPFKDLRREELLGLLVMKKYFELSGQM